MDSSIYFSLTNGCRWETGLFFVTQNVSIKGHFNHMPNVLPLELPWPDSFHLMYLNTGCGGKLKYNNKVFICKGSMWNANCAQADGFSWETSHFFGRECLIPWNLYTHSFIRLAECSTIWSDQGWVSSGRNLFLPGHPEKSGRNLFLPVLSGSGQNWKKLDKTMKEVRNAGKT